MKILKITWMIQIALNIGYEKEKIINLQIN